VNRLSANKVTLDRIANDRLGVVANTCRTGLFVKLGSLWATLRRIAPPDGLRVSLESPT
jgi:hypothetical protein